jgi:hypothetical protein
MDANHFDFLARSLTVAGSRRRALVATLGGAVGVVLGAPPVWETGAKKKSCSQCKKRKNGKCKPKRNGTACGQGGICQRGSCICPSGTELCGGACVPACAASGETVRNPITCACCRHGGGGSGNPCDPANNDCCSGNCVPGFNICGDPVNDTCTFNAQCFNGNCDGGTCR